jgi:hypothetical protein
MSYEELIVAIENEGTQLSCVAYRLLWRLVSISIQQGSNEVNVSCRTLASQLGVARNSIAQAHRDLAPFIGVAVTNGSTATFTLPAEWFSPQRALFATLSPKPVIHNLARNRAGTWHETEPVPGTKLSRTWHETEPVPGTKLSRTWHETEPDLARNCARPGTKLSQLDADTYRNARARIDRSISSCSTPSGLVVLIDRALRTVEILPQQEQDAEILRGALCDYRRDLDAPSLYPGGPDQVAIARILAIAPIEDICGVLRKLLTARVHPGKQDMWFFTVLMQKLHGAPPKLVADRYDSMKRKKPPMNETLPNFGPELLSEVAAGMRHF